MAEDILDAGSVVGMWKKALRTMIKQSGGQLARHMQKSYKESGRKKELPQMLGLISNMYAKKGMRYTKDYLKEHYGFSWNDVNKGLVWTPGNNKGRKPTVHVRGSIKDTLDYEFYGVPQGTFPNVTRLRNWVRTRVILRDTGLRSEYTKSVKGDKTKMLDELTFKFGKAIQQHGLKRRSTTKFEETQDPKLLEQGIMVVHKGKKVPVKQLTKKEAIGRDDI